MGYGSGGKMDGCSKCMKYSLFASNFVILLGGIAVAVVGGMTLHDQTIFEQLVGDSMYRSSSYILIGTGIFIILFSFLGCVGAVKEIKCFLLTYIIVLLIFCVVLLIGGVLGYVFNGKVSEPLKTDMLNEMERYNKSDTIRLAWDNVQAAFSCCGIYSYTDWYHVFNGEEHIPPSCCKKREEVPQCQIEPTEETIYTTGCLTRFKQGANIVGAFGITVACFLILGLAFSVGVFQSRT